ncbi:MAG: patatin-like phospholipase family protein [Paralcaligenes sp.]
MAKPKTALVLSGGGSLGAVQVGMLQALSRTDLSPDMVIGASVGALNGAVFAEDPTPAGADRLAELWRGLRRKDVFPLTLLAGLRPLLFARDYMIEANALRALTRRALCMMPHAFWYCLPERVARCRRHQEIWKHWPCACWAYRTCVNLTEM